MPRRGRWTATLALTGSALAISAALPATPAAAATARDTGAIPNGTTLSGVVDRGGAAGAASFGAWRGRPVSVVTDYLGGSNWSSIANTSWTGYRWAGTHYHYVWSMFMLPMDRSGNMSAGASGAYNRYFRQAAQGLVNNGYGSSTIRLGWELTGNWYPWAALNNPSAFAAYWRQIVTTMRSVPGAHFTFDFNISNQGKSPLAAYPGDAYVDYVGGDFYDETWKPYGPKNHTAVWNELLNQPYGMNWLASFAAAHGKRLSLPEWALVYRCDGHGGGDNPSFITNMRNWISSHNVAYETYFNAADNDCQTFKLDNGHFWSARNQYKTLFSKGVATTALSSSNSPSGITVGVNKNRSGGWTLNGGTVSGKVYIWEKAPNNSVKVQFVLDGKNYHYEATAPYDLQGGSSSAANALNTANLAAGKHTLKAVVSGGGVNRTDSATFTVKH